MQEPHQLAEGVQCTQSQKAAAEWIFLNLSEISQEFPNALNATEMEVERVAPKSPRQASTARWRASASPLADPRQTKAGADGRAAAKPGPSSWRISAMSTSKRGI